MSDLMSELTDQANRANPWPIYAEFRAQRIVPIGNGNHAFARYDDVIALLRDPRLSADPHNMNDPEGVLVMDNMPFINTDPPRHDVMREAVTRAFGPPVTPGLVTGQDLPIQHDVARLIDAFPESGEIDLVDQFSYPLPVSVICRLLGVPLEDEDKFKGWAEDAVGGIDAGHQEGAEELGKRRDAAVFALAGYIGELIQRHRSEPDESMLSRLVQDGRLTDQDLMITGMMLFIAGHETTVNLIGNGMLTLLRNPSALERLRREPDLAIPMVEELLRLEPPVQYIPDRSALVDFEFDGVKIEKGSKLFLMLAAANRDPARFADPDRFNPDRGDIQHVGFGGGIHYCFGAPLARLEAARALVALSQRLQNPRLVEDPPPYRPSPVLRGPLHLRIGYDAVAPAGA
jgi:cytochrome P450